MAKANCTCSIEQCDKKATAPRGWCWTHYGRWRRTGDPLQLFVQAQCSVAACESMSRVSGMCDMHYRRSRKGDVNKGRPNHGPDCSVESCEEPHHQAGLCRRHYFVRWTTQGNGHDRLAAARARRRARVANSPVIESGLSWRSLWAEGLRDCYLCGITCNPNDYCKATNRAGWEQHISGPTYPSLDHIQALANGGEHSRANVAMACSNCNRRKHSKVDYEAQLMASSKDAGAHR